MNFASCVSSIYILRALDRSYAGDHLLESLITITKSAKDHDKQTPPKVPHDMPY